MIETGMCDDHRFRSITAEILRTCHECREETIEALSDSRKKLWDARLGRDENLLRDGAINSFLKTKTLEGIESTPFAKMTGDDIMWLILSLRETNK